MAYEVSFPSIIGGSPLVSGDLEICIELPPPTLKMQQKSLNLHETTEANWLWGLFPIYYWGKPPW